MSSTNAPTKTDMEQKAAHKPPHPPQRTPAPAPSDNKATRKPPLGKQQRRWSSASTVSTVSYDGSVGFSLEDMLTDEDNTDLASCCRDGDLAMAKSLLRHNADINEIGESGKPPIVLAAEGGHTAVVKLLIDEGAIFDTNETLMYASQSAHLDLAKYLVNFQEADVNASNSVGWSALSFAADAGHPDVVKFLVESKANVNHATSVGRTPLMLAAEKNHLDVVMYLHGQQVDLKKEDAWGSTAMDLALAQRNTVSEFLERPDTFTRQVNSYTGQLQLWVLAGRSLPKSDVGGTSDPYVKISIGAEEVERTSVMKQTVDPRWKQQFKIRISGSSQHLILSVFDWDQLSSDDFMCQVTVPFYDFRDKTSTTKPEWYACTDAKGEGADTLKFGQLRLKMRYVPDSEGDGGGEGGGKRRKERYGTFPMRGKKGGRPGLSSMFAMLDSSPSPSFSPQPQVGTMPRNGDSKRWVFYPNFESPGNTVKRVRSSKHQSIDDMKRQCLKEGAVAFTTSGKIKSKILPKDEWKRLTLFRKGPSKGMYVLV